MEGSILLDGGENADAAATLVDRFRQGVRYGAVLFFSAMGHVFHGSSKSVQEFLCGYFAHDGMLKLEDTFSEPLRAITAMLPGS